MDIKQIKKSIISFIKTHAGNRPVVIGLSGGLDSSVTAFLAVEALGADKVRGLIMPSDTNSEEETRLAKQVSEDLGIKYETHGISGITECFQKEAGILKDKQKTLGNLKARIRMSLLYCKANELGALVLGTGNKTELMTGYFTKYGDGGSDLLPIGGLYKTDERVLAEYIGIPKKIIEMAPTAGLWEGQTDEGELGIDYETLDKILRAIEHRGDLDCFEKKDVELARGMVSNSTHKRQTPPICEIQT